jgi:hypothetical protein
MSSLHHPRVQERVPNATDTLHLARISVTDSPANPKNKVLEFQTRQYDPITFRVFTPPKERLKQKVLEDIKEFFNSRRHMFFRVDVTVFPTERQSAREEVFDQETVERLLQDHSTQFSLCEGHKGERTDLNKGYNRALIFLRTYRKEDPTNGNFVRLYITPVTNLPPLEAISDRVRGSGQ